MKERELIFWDFDGVIKESVSVKTQGYIKLFLGHGEDLASRIRAHHEANGGVSRNEKIPLYLNWAGEPVTPELVRDYCDRFSKFVCAAVVASPWVPGVREYMEEHFSLQKFVLITATPDQEIKWILDQLGIAGYFREVYGASTPKKVAIQKVLENSGCRRVDALVVGDSTTDFEAALENGVDFLLRCSPMNQSLQRRHSGPRFEVLRDE